ncbi:putative beta-lactamase [Magnetofaba australis IT-1]|uniref:Beta-lactamase n=2 Tax=Magnetofaba TaxID=1472292 RepID=A0A1Y2K4C3_9PROT|nr:putative beta-lactamase [Magnetofaba australis IT-1]
MDACQQRWIPASTFKIPNTLIALETGAVNTTEVFKWDGSPQAFKPWERDMTLQQALKVSAVPVYQRIARRIGLSRMATWVKRLNFGSGDIGDTVDNFWLQGPLTISPIEQARFMQRVATNDLPLRPETLSTLHQIIPQQAWGGGQLRGKTGWLTRVGAKRGWYVGWFTPSSSSAAKNKGDQTVAFAVNIPMPELKLAPLRIALAKRALQAGGWAQQEAD